MKNIIVILVLLTSCKTKIHQTICQEENDSESKISIMKNYKELNSESLLLNISAKFKITSNSKNHLMMILIKKDNKIAYDARDYIILDENFKPIYDIENRGSSGEDLIINVIFRDIMLSKIKFNRKVTERTDKLNIGDTLKVSYKDFKRNNPLVFEELNRIGDTIIVRNFSKGDFLEEERIRIHW